MASTNRLAEKEKVVERPVKYPKPTTEWPSTEQLQEWEFDCGCEATDGCWVEPDGWCEHGHVSWFIYMGLI
jgi:hypothetical protein